VPERIKWTLTGYIAYRSQGHYAFLLHRISGLATVGCLTLHILTTATVFFFPQWYDPLVRVYSHPLIMTIEILLAFFVIFHGVNGLRILYLDLFRPDLWAKQTARKAITTVFLVAFVLWLPVLLVMGYALLRHGFGLLGG
jgi:succinate dehydrogenase / fumarate reductase cytochrome b subunit